MKNNAMLFVFGALSAVIGGLTLLQTASATPPTYVGCGDTCNLGGLSSLL